MKIPKLRRNPDGRAFVQLPKQKGKRVYFGKYDTPAAKASYEAWVKQYVSTDGRSAIKDSDVFVVEAAAEYLKMRKAKKDTGAYKTYKSSLSHFIKFVGTVRGSQITVPLFKNFQDYLANMTYQKGSQTVQLSRITAVDIARRTKYFIRWSCEQNLFPIEVWHRIQLVKQLDLDKGRQSPPKQPVSWDDLQKTLPFLSPIARYMTQVQYLSGMRPGEVCRLRRDMIDREGRLVDTPEGPIRIWLVSYKEHKNAYRGHSLVKAIPPKAQELLLEWEARGDCNEYFFSPVQNRKDAYGWSGPWVEGLNPEQDQVLKGCKKTYNSSSYSTMVKAGVERALNALPQLPAWTPNLLRHGMATMIRDEIGIEEAQIYAGHKHIDTTLIYAKQTENKLLKISAAFHQLVTTQSGS